MKSYILLLEYARKKVIGKLYGGKLHVQFDEGTVGGSPLFYSTIRE